MHHEVGRPKRLLTNRKLHLQYDRLFSKLTIIGVLYLRTGLTENIEKIHFSNDYDLIFFEIFK